jgi:DnaJ-class molecular chaperone
VYTTLHVSLTQAILGGKIKVQTLYGEVQTDLPENLKADSMFILKNFGLPYPDQDGKKGDHYLNIKYVMPKYLNKNQTSLWSAFSELEN